MAVILTRVSRCRGPHGRFLENVTKNIANMKLECSFGCWSLEQEGGEAENISNFEHFYKYNVQHLVSYEFLNITLNYIH